MRLAFLLLAVWFSPRRLHSLCFTLGSIVITRLTIGKFAFALGLALLAWLPLGILRIVPFVLALPGEPQLRVHASAAVGSLLIAAWGFWE